MTRLTRTLSQVLVAASIAAMAGGAVGQTLQSTTGSGSMAQATRTMNHSQSNAHTPLGGNSFSAYCTYHYAGLKTRIQCLDSGITAHSRVVAAISEYGQDPQTERFLGDARMTVNNVVPFNGGVELLTDVDWATALNVRLDILVDP